MLGQEIYLSMDVQEGDAIVAGVEPNTDELNTLF